MSTDTITVTSPLLPNLDELHKLLQDIWDAKWITNMGQFHKQLEQSLADYLHVPYVCLFTNGTLPLMTALQALRITGEVITTPYSFVATTHSIWWNGCKPVFVDIDPATGNMNPDKIEAAITPATTCIMPVHVYGKPCDTKRIQEIADKYGLKVIYDAAHAFGVEVPAEQYGLEAYDEKGLAGIMNAGDMSTLSFHATKVYNTIEGGALVVHDEKTKKRIDNLKNFGIIDDVTVVAPGINGKMDEIRSAYGLLNLKQVDAAIEARHQVAIKYREALCDIDGIKCWNDLPNVKHNYSYFPIFVDADKFGMTRDELFYKMRKQNILCRRYFYPLISNFPTYRGLPSAVPENLPIGNKMADEVLCLPMHHALSDQEIQRILTTIIK
jgi:dTDP-4-amino-4,6-dideoxygalactose transaminase